MATPKVKAGEDTESFIEPCSPSEAETCLTDTCGYCGQPKRPENSTPQKPSQFCKCPSASESTDPSIRLGTVPSSAFKRDPSPRRSLGGGVLPPADRVYEGGKLEIVSIREKHGEFRKAVPAMPLPAALLLCLLNVLLPGLGTLLSAVGVCCGCETEHGDRRRSLSYTLLAALLQLLLAPIIVGWVWSVLWGITFVNLSVSKAVEDPSSNSML